MPPDSPAFDKCVPPDPPATSRHPIPAPARPGKAGASADSARNRGPELDRRESRTPAGRRTHGGVRNTEPIVRVTPVAGTLLVLTHNVLHQGATVTAGTKYVLRSDVMYRWEASPVGG